MSAVLGDLLGIPIVVSPFVPEGRALLIDRRIFTPDPGAFAHRMQMEGIKRAMRADLEILLDAFAARWGITR